MAGLGQNSFPEDNRWPYELGQPVLKSFDVADPTQKYSKGTPLTLQTDGTVKVAEVGEIPFGVVAVENSTESYYNPSTHYGSVTVRLMALGVTYGKAKAAINTGVYVQPDDFNANLVDTAYQAATTGEYATAIALNTTAAAGDKIEVAILNAPMYIP